MNDSYLQRLVIERCKELGDEKSAEFFGVSASLIRQWVNGSKTPSLAAVEKVFVLPEGKPADAAWEGKEVFIAAPFHKSTNPMTLFSLLAVWDRPKMGYRHRFGDAFIIHARNQLADDFLKSSLPVCQWFDDDMLAPCGSAGWYLENSGIPMPEKFAGVHFINQLRSRGKSLIGGLYFGRWAHGRAMYAEAATDDTENARAHTAPFDEVRPTEWVGTGCLQHTRQVLLDIQASHPHLAPQHPTEPWHFFSPTSDALVRGFAEIQTRADNLSRLIGGGSIEAAGKEVADLLKLVADSRKEFIQTNRLNQGEDQMFCRRAAKAGHPAHVDFSVVCGHLGSQVYGPHNTK